MSTLWESTRDLHHACEGHSVGEAMASGKPPINWYAQWVKALHQIHTVIDPHLPEAVHRSDRIQQDLDALNEANCEPLLSAQTYADSLTNDNAIAGAAYVLTGAHLMGGEVMRRRLDGYPTNHLLWDDRKQALAVLKSYRNQGHLTTQARDCFYALLCIMDEIERVNS